MTTPLKPAWVIALCILMGCSKPSASKDPSLEKAVMEDLDFSAFDSTKLEDHLSVAVSSNEGRRFFNRESIEAFHQDAQTRKITYTTSNFKVLWEDEPPDCHYASISYEVTWHAKNSAGVEETLTRSHSQEIWERQVDGWHRLYAAIDSDAVTDKPN